MTRDELLRKLDAITQSAPGSVRPEAELETLRGWDSLANVEFRMIVEDELGLDLDGLAVDRARTVAELLALVGHRLEA